jgi:hypothetical protein
MTFFVGRVGGTGFSGGFRGMAKWFELLKNLLLCVLSADRSVNLQLFLVRCFFPFAETTTTTATMRMAGDKYMYSVNSKYTIYTHNNSHKQQNSTKQKSSRIFMKPRRLGTCKKWENGEYTNCKM